MSRASRILFQSFSLHYVVGATSVQYTVYCPEYTVCVSNCSLDSNEIGPEGGVALGEALTVNQTLQTLR